MVFLSREVVYSTIGIGPNEIYRRVVHSTIGVCPNENIGGLSTVPSESVQMKYSGGWSNILSASVQRTFAITKTKTFCFRNNFHTWKKCMCEEVGEDSRHGAWHMTFVGF